MHCADRFGFKCNVQREGLQYSARMASVKHIKTDKTIGYVPTHDMDWQGMLLALIDGK